MESGFTIGELMNVFVTGGTGFIGYNLLEQLVKRGDDISVLVRSKGKIDNRELFEECDVIEGDMSDVSTMSRGMKDADVVFHQAACSTPNEFREDVAKGVVANVLGIVNVFEAASRSNVGRLIFASSSSVYGDARIPHKETTNLSPVNSYGESKVIGEKIARIFSRGLDMKVIGLRYFSVYGFRDKTKGRYANLITQVYEAALNNNRRPIIPGNPSYTRDYVFVSDIVQANLLAMNVKSKSSFSVYNVGSGEMYSLSEAVEIIGDTIGVDISPQYVLNKEKTHIEHTLADISKIKKELGYNPKMNLRDGIRLMWERDTA